MLVDRAALGRHVAPKGGQRLLQPSTAVDDQELWLAQPALDEIIPDGTRPHAAALQTQVITTSRREDFPGVETVLREAGSPAVTAEEPTHRCSF